MNKILSAAEIHDLQENLKRRGKSFKAGMLLLVDALKNIELTKSVNNKETSQFIQNYENTIDEIDNFYEEYKSNLDDITKDNLRDLLSKYKQLLRVNSILKDPSQSFESLRDAERYLVWKNGREAFDTLVKSSQLEITQQEIPYHDPDLLAEEYKKLNDKTPPFWFQWLSPWQQGFIRDNQATLLKNTILLLYALSLDWRIYQNTFAVLTVLKA